MKAKSSISARNIPRPKIHPGVILRKHVLETRKLSQTAFARSTGLPVSRINEIINGKRGLTMDAVIRFAKVLGTSEGFWINLQAAYDKAEALETRASEYALLKALPLPEAA
jgi:addiction module HigA family antidote